MARFLVDEDLPRSLAVGARARGIDAIHVLDAGLRSRPDREIFTIAVTQGRSVATADREFGNPIRYPPRSHSGVVLVRISEDLAPKRRIDRILDALLTLAGLDLSGTVAVVEMARTRIRRFRP